MAGDVNGAMDTVAAACRPWDFLEGAMAFEKSPQLRNHVSVVCARADVEPPTISATPSLNLAETAVTI